MLVFVEGGPEVFANKAFESDVLTDHPEFENDQYRWTSRTIRSTRFPDKVAQVWRHVSLGEDEGQAGTSPVPSAAENPNSTASTDTTNEADAFASAMVYREAEASVRLDGETHVVGDPEQAQPVPSPLVEESGTSESSVLQDHTGETPDVLDGNEPLPDGEQLFLRRKRLKMTVQQVADQAGLARSKVDSIEKGTGKRIKAAEVLAVVNVLKAAEGGDESPRE